MSAHPDLVARSRRSFPGARIADEFDYPEFRTRCLALLSETVPPHWSAEDRLTCALRGLALLVERNSGNVREFAIRLFDELGSYA